jgi:hypothetical protein
MYKTKYECRYYRDNIILPNEKITLEEEEYVRDILYREDYLNIFSIEDCDNNANDNELFSKAIDNLFEKIKESDVLKIFMLKAAANLISEDLQLGLCLLYSYDYMYITHLCVSEYLDTGFVSLDNIDKMNKILK